MRGLRYPLGGLRSKAMPLASRRIQITLCVVGIAITMTSRAYAVATYFSDVDVTTTFVSLTAGATVGFGAEDISTFPGPTTFGTGVISTDVGVNDAGWGSLDAASGGSASSLPNSGAIMRREIHDFIEVDAVAVTGTAVLEFTLDYDVSSSVSTTVAGDSAFSNYNIHITGIGDEVGEIAEFSLDGGSTFFPILRLEDALTFPAPIGPEFQLDVGQSVSGPGGSDSAAHTGTVTVRYIVDGGDDYAFSIFTRAGDAAFAIPTAPEPSTFLLATLGFLSLSCCRRRCR